MTHYDLLLALQLMSEERVGHPARERERAEHAHDSEAIRRLRSVKR